MYHYWLLLCSHLPSKEHIPLCPKDSTEPCMSEIRNILHLDGTWKSLLYVQNFKTCIYPQSIPFRAIWNRQTSDNSWHDLMFSLRCFSSNPDTVGYRSSLEVSQGTWNLRAPRRGHDESPRLWFTIDWSSPDRNFFRWGPWGSWSRWIESHRNKCGTDIDLDNTSPHTEQWAMTMNDVDTVNSVMKGPGFFCSVCIKMHRSRNEKHLDKV